MTTTNKYAPPLFGVAVMLAMIAMFTAPASALDINGWENSNGPGYDFYLTGSTEVNPTELALLVNYDSYDMILKVTSDNQSYYSQVIAPHSSLFMELPFTDVETSYKVTISENGHALATLTKERPSFLLPPPKDSGWHIAAPDKSDPLVYSEKALSAIVANITLNTIITAIVIIALGALLGAVVKQITRFLAPTDFISIIFTALMFLDIPFNLFGFMGDYNKLWDLALIVGYQLGFWLWHIDYFIPIKTDCKEKTVSQLPIAYYFPDDATGCCIATQTNRALFKRLFLGIHHRLGTDVGITQDWSTIAKKPYLPKIRARALWLEKDETFVTKSKWWIFTFEQYRTEYKLAHASKVEKSEWLVHAEAYFDIQDMYDRLWLKYVRLIMRRRSDTVQAAGTMMEHSMEVTPQQYVKKIFAAWPKEDVTINDIGESKMTIIEAADMNGQDESPAYLPEEVEADQEEAPSTKPQRNTTPQARRARGKKPQQIEQED